MIEIISFDGHNINDGSNYEAMFPDSPFELPDTSVTLIERNQYWPLTAGIRRQGRRIAVHITIMGSNVDTLRLQLMQWFDPEDETPKKLLAGIYGNSRYLMAICESLRAISGKASLMYAAMLIIDDDVRWRADSATTPAVWNITSGTALNLLAVGGEDKAYPVISITPNLAKTGSNPYKRFFTVRWRAPEEYSMYPVDIGNGSYDTRIASTNHALANGDDLRVIVDGTEVNRWLVNPNTAGTKIWVNLDFRADVAMTLKTAIAGAGAIDTIEVNEAIGGVVVKGAGILLIDSELFVFTGKNDPTSAFSGITRAEKGTSAGAHTVGTAVYWIQHDIWMTYGDAGAGAPTLDNNYAPAFDYTNSSNTSWVYTEFGENDGLRPASWYWTQLKGYMESYTGNRGARADPWVEVGQHADASSRYRQFSGRISFHNPCEMTQVAYSNGEMYDDTTAVWQAEIISYSRTTGEASEYTIPAPGSKATWTAWSRTETLNSGTITVSLQLIANFVDNSLRHAYLECADVTVTLNSSMTPVPTTGAEIGNYQVAIKMTNQNYVDTRTVSGFLELLINFEMGLSETLEIDTAQKTVTYLKDNSRQIQAITLVGGPRKDWFPFEGGASNALTFEDTGTNDLDIQFSYRARYYS